jgi:7,8-dihydroneopterin aldolase/epimerase/oxygenase
VISFESFVVIFFFDIVPRHVYFKVQTYYNLKNMKSGSPEIDNFTVPKQQIMGTILLEGMEFFAFHGCFREEQIIGTNFIVDLYVDAETTGAEGSDHLRDTVDYAALYQCVKDEMEKKSHLLEHVGKRILDAVRNGFPAINAIDLKIAKINPPIGGKMRQVSFKTQWKK